VARVAAGDAPRLEAAQTELALADADNELTGAHGEVEAGRADLNVLLGQPPAAPVTLTDGLRASPLPGFEEVSARAAGSNVGLRVLDRRIAEQQMRRNLARAMQTPDISAGSTFTYHAQPEFGYGWRLSLGVTLPIFASHRAAVLAEDAQLARLQAERDAAAATVAAAVAAALARASALGAQLARYDAEILPRARDIEGMAQDGYAAGQTGLVALLQVMQSTREVRRKGLQAALDYQLALTDLERAIGAPLVR
jgi:outer membrane protein TolC